MADKDKETELMEKLNTKIKEFEDKMCQLVKDDIESSGEACEAVIPTYILEDMENYIGEPIILMGIC